MLLWVDAMVTSFKRRLHKSGWPLQANSEPVWLWEKTIEEWIMARTMISLAKAIMIKNPQKSYFPVGCRMRRGMEFKDFKLDQSELDFQYVRSSGAGGQNVNKVATKAVLRWKILASNCLSVPVKRRFLSRYASRITEGGEIILSCDATRYQSHNKRIVTERLEAMIQTVWSAPKKRKKTKIPKSVNEKRLRDKRSRSGRIQARRSSDD